MVRQLFAEALARHGLTPNIDDAYKAELGPCRPKAAGIEHDPEKWTPVFGKDLAPPKCECEMTIRR